MKDFVKFTLATIVGIILTGVIVSVISLFAIAGMMVAGNATTTVQKNSVMVLNLSGNITEQAQEDPISFLLGDDYSSAGLNDILASIKKAANHDKIKGIYLKAGVLVASPATIQEIRNALLEFKKSGKFIVSYADVYTQGNYYLCSVADKLMINPQGSINWSGLSSQPIYYKDMLDKIGVEMQVFKVGTYKSAVEPYLSNKMSDANREQINAFLSSIWNQMLEGVSVSRNIPKKNLDFFADQMLMLCDAGEYVKHGLVDTLIYKNDVPKYMQTLLGVKSEKDVHNLSLQDMINVADPVEQSSAKDVIAVYYAEGEIDLSTTEGIISKKVCKDLSELRDDDDVKAVVLRVNSPGGSSFGSEQIWHEVMALKAKKPVIVSMGGYAASGGYYMSCAADRIYAEPTTLTGSIGIFGMFPNMQKLLNDKLGIHSEAVKTNKFSDLGTPFRPFNEEERGYLQAMIERGYELFVTRCADGRGMTKEAIMKIAEGRVWTGETAKKLGLVDELGGLDDAVKGAAKEAGLTEYSLSTYPEPENILMRLLDMEKDDYVNAHIEQTFGEYYRCIRFLKKADEQDPVQARMPYEINFNL